MSDDTLHTIFGTILDWHLTSQDFPAAVRGLSRQLISATLALYNAASGKLLPTPTKSHYLFNPRDFARVVQVWARVQAGGCRRASLCRQLAPHACCRAHAKAATTGDCCPCTQGLMLLPPTALPQADGAGAGAAGPAAAAYKRLWVHEALRVFYDRLVDDGDRAWLLGQLQDISAAHLGGGLQQLMGHLLRPGETEVGPEQLRR